MFELKISDIFEAVKLSQEWATHTISVVDPGIEDCGIDIKLPIVSPNHKLRRYYFILDFTAPLTSADKLLVHCQAGISRSTAVACGVLCQHGLSPSEAIPFVLSIRPQAQPNLHVLRLFDEILGLEGKLFDSP